MSESVDRTVDVVVVGTGGAGFAAALGAVDEGLSVLLIESTDKWGGAPPCPGAACGCRPTP